MNHKITCPFCNAVLKSKTPIKPGITMKCPKCHEQIKTVPTPAVVPPVDTGISVLPLAPTSAPTPAPAPTPTPTSTGIRVATPAALATPATGLMRAKPVSRPRGETRRLNIEGRQVYFNAVLGGIGGLLAWLAVVILGLIVPLQQLPLYARDALIGPLLGIWIGFAIGSTDGLVVAKSVRRFLIGAGIGAALGALGGLIGLLLGEFIFSSAGGGVWSRSLGWAIFGMLVGTCDGVAQRMPSKIRYGILGGLLGGLIGGSTYEALVSVLGRTGFRVSALAWGSAIGLIILGACIGALIGLVESLLRKAWVFFVMGRLEGQTRTLDPHRPMTFGRSDKCNIVLPEDQTIAPVHAEIVRQGKEFVVRARDGSVIVSRAGQEQEVTSHVLEPGDRIYLGQSRMIFRTEETKKS